MIVGMVIAFIVFSVFNPFILANWDTINAPTLLTRAGGRT